MREALIVWGGWPGHEPEQGAAAVVWDTTPDPFFNINTADDLEIARSLLKALTP